MSATVLLASLGCSKDRLGVVRIAGSSKDRLGVVKQFANGLNWFPSRPPSSDSQEMPNNGRAYNYDNLNRSDKERLIIKLHREDRNWDYIAEASHSSMSTIKKVIDRYEQPKAPKAKNVESRALQMYNKNYTPLQVAIKLNITSDEAVNYQIEFWKLKGMTWLREMYEQYKELSSRIVSRMYDLGIAEFSTEKLVTTLHLASTLPQMHTQFEDLTKKIQDKQSAYQAMQKESSNIQHRLFNDREKYHTLQNSIHVMTQEKEDLKQETDKMYSIIAEIKSSKTYDRAKEKISNAVKEVLGDKNTLLYAVCRIDNSRSFRESRLYDSCQPYFIG